MNYRAGNFVKYRCNILVVNSLFLSSFKFAIPGALHVNRYNSNPIIEKKKITIGQPAFKGFDTEVLT
jgi:hypothetical protein